MSTRQLADIPTQRGDQYVLPGALMRGGSSRGPFFCATDLPADHESRDRVLLQVMGSPHPLQVDGVGGANPLTSKVGIVESSELDGVDLDFTFAQLQPNETTVQTTANCGNMLAAALPFAIERGLIEPSSDTTTAKIRTTNTGLVSEITVQTPCDSAGKRYVAYAGDTSIAGVPGTGSPVEIMFVNTAGSIAPALYPTGNLSDVVQLKSGREITVTCIDNGQPLVMIQATDLGKKGDETPEELEADSQLKELLEELRLACGHLMQLGDVSEKSYPKMTLVAPAQAGGAIATRSFIPHVVHRSLGVLAAVTVATAATTEGTVAYPLTKQQEGKERKISIEHPSGIFDVDMKFDDSGAVIGAGITRTARLIAESKFMLPLSTFNQ